MNCRLPKLRLGQDAEHVGVILGTRVHCVHPSCMMAQEMPPNEALGIHDPISEVNRWNELMDVEKAGRKERKRKRLKTTWTGDRSGVRLPQLCRRIFPSTTLHPQPPRYVIAWSYHAPIASLLPTQGNRMKEKRYEELQRQPLSTFIF